ncbi:adenylate cyclase [Haemophilus paracuniculus]|uniref:Adenylate cyclase n=1 Tax=Haemophilus paracuniculus TaxID=734 RepID=A0A1T0AVK2_9PAST|nr:adenylate cyclase [Haemophilus paracuniculus]
MKNLDFVHFDESSLPSNADFSQQLEWAKQRVSALEQYRLARATAENSLEFQRVLELVPLLLHLNHPDLPAYVEYAPSGVAQFELSPYQQHYLAEHYLLPILNSAKYQPSFDGLYLMGSTGSITQTSLSDLDLWVCHSQRLNRIEIAQLEIKFERLKNWVNQFGVEINFYLMHQDYFRRNMKTGVGSENCGSAQHFILLDEFYRSAIRLNGKRLLWLHFDEQGKDYRQQVETAVRAKQLDLNEWIDFGDLSSLSIDEYFGASLWQLYKGINAPYKSAIKILLLESYAQTYPKTNLIAKKFKQRLLTENGENYHFDPYLAMLEQVTDYLTERQEFERLNRLRYCFYLKSQEGNAFSGWRKKQLANLIQDWGWSQKDLNLLTSRKAWKIKQAIAQQNMLTEQLLLSYRHLINFARKFHIDPSIIASDTDILMRKLYSIFEILPGKVALINPHISANLAEQAVTFIEVKEGSAMKSGWYMINQSPKSPYDSSSRHIQYYRHLNHLIAWAYFNGIITPNTVIHLVSQSVELNKLRQFITDLRLSFPQQAPLISEQDLHHPNEIRNLTVVVNLTQDPTAKKNKKIPTKISQSDLFNFDYSQQNLIGSVSLIYRNVWNEIHTQHFEGNDSLLKALKLISNKIYRSSAPPQSVSVLCYSEKLKEELQLLISALVNRCISVQTSTVFQKQQMNTLFQQGENWGKIFQSKQPLQDFSERYFPREIDQFASEGFLQFFFEDNLDQSFNVYILNEQNKIEQYHYCLGSKEEKIKTVNRFFTEQKLANWESFHYPQFYQLLNYRTHIEIVPFQSQKHQEYQKNALVD